MKLKKLVTIIALTGFSAMALAHEDEISAQIFEPSDGQELAVLSAEEMANTKGAMSLPEVNVGNNINNNLQSAELTTRQRIVNAVVNNAKFKATAGGSNVVAQTLQHYDAEGPISHRIYGGIRAFAIGYAAGSVGSFIAGTGAMGTMLSVVPAHYGNKGIDDLYY